MHQHKNYPNGTLQIGDGDHIAVKTGIITVSDFRQKHLAAGGEGAPLAAYGDFILFHEKENNIILLNMGGIANFTWLPAGAAFNKIVCTDTGPGNTMMDAWTQKNYPGKYFDSNGAIALQGTLHSGLLNALKENDFFKLLLPKTTGPELFNPGYLETAMQKSGTTTLQAADVMATLNRFTAETICEAIERVTGSKDDFKIFVSGGGMHNPLLMDHINGYFRNISIHTTAEKNIHPDAKEAVLFAILANECVAGNGNNLGEGTDHFPAINMGKISLPV
jgi:anhydro-N-acetylmuramic acid kinase